VSSVSGSDTARNPLISIENVPYFTLGETLDRSTNAVVVPAEPSSVPVAITVPAAMGCFARACGVLMRVAHRCDGQWLGVAQPGRSYSPIWLRCRRI
jgi:hypothetical protein